MFGVLGMGTSAVYWTGIEGEISLPASMLPSPKVNFCPSLKEANTTLGLRWLDLKV